MKILKIEIDISTDKKIDYCYIWNVPKWKIKPQTLIMKVKKADLIERLPFIKALHLTPGSNFVYMNNDKLFKLKQLKQL